LLMDVSHLAQPSWRYSFTHSPVPSIKLQLSHIRHDGVGGAEIQGDALAKRKPSRLCQESNKSIRTCSGRTLVAMRSGVSRLRLLHTCIHSRVGTSYYTGFCPYVRVITVRRLKLAPWNKYSVLW
jgi:hypothetical protein